jgi:hypothetical protein
MLACRGAWGQPVHLPADMQAVAFTALGIWLLLMLLMLLHFVGRCCGWWWWHIPASWVYSYTQWAAYAVMRLHCMNAVPMGCGW